jgi:hypothetical protein
VHLDLVAALVCWLRCDCGTDDGIVLADSRAARPGSRPPAIQGYIPDLFVPRSRDAGAIIGEAKTPRDLHLPHSQEQISAFLVWCSRHPGSLLVVAVPWYMTRAARLELRLLQARANAQWAHALVPDGFPG